MNLLLQRTVLSFGWPSNSCMASISMTTVYSQLPFVPSSPSESSNTANALPPPSTTKNQGPSNNTTSASSFVDDGSIYIAQYPSEYRKNSCVFNFSDFMRRLVFCFCILIDLSYKPKVNPSLIIVR